MLEQGTGVNTCHIGHDTRQPTLCKYFIKKIIYYIDGARSLGANTHTCIFLILDPK